MRLQQVAGEEGLGGPHAAEEAVGAQQRRGQRPAAAGAAGTGSPRHSHAGQGPGRQRRVAAGPPRVPVVSPPPSPVTSRRRHQPQGAPPRRRSSSPFAAGRGRAHEPAADWVEPPPPGKPANGERGAWREGVAGEKHVCAARGGAALLEGRPGKGAGGAETAPSRPTPRDFPGTDLCEEPPPAVPVLRCLAQAPAVAVREGVKGIVVDRVLANEYLDYCIKNTCC